MKLERNRGTRTAGLLIEIMAASLTRIEVNRVAKLKGGTTLTSITTIIRGRETFLYQKTSSHSLLRGSINPF